MLFKLFYRLRCRGKDSFCIAVAMVIVETQQILLDNVYILKGSAFQDLWLIVTHKNCNQTTNVIARLYYDHICLNGPKTKNSYEKTDLAILWFLNTPRY